MLHTVRRLSCLAASINWSELSLADVKSSLLLPMLMLTIYKFHDAFASICSICLLCWGHVALWLCRLLMNKVVGPSIHTHSFHIPPSPTAQPSNWGYLSLYLAWVLCFALLTFRLSMGSSTFPIPHYPVPQQHLFNFLCGAIRAAHPSLSLSPSPLCRSPQAIWNEKLSAI